ncbi:MAG: ERF family protein [Oscillospiraceae bacterium]|nr:ERF family protein [Oscillospiraceae bacterium]
MSENKTNINNIYTKLQTAKKLLSEKNIKKSGKNSYSGFEYFELSDFLPSIIEIFADIGLFSKITFTDEMATLKIVNAENPAEVEEYTSPMRTLELKGANLIQALGGIQTYQRRYLYMAALDITESDMFDANSGKKEPEIKPESKTAKEYMQESRERDKQRRIDMGTDWESPISAAQARVLISDTKEAEVLKIAAEFGYDKMFSIKKKDYDTILKKITDAKLNKNAQPA